MLEGLRVLGDWLEDYSDAWYLLRAVQGRFLGPWAHLLCVPLASLLVCIAVRHPTTIQGSLALGELSSRISHEALESRRGGEGRA